MTTLKSACLMSYGARDMHVVYMCINSRYKSRQ